MTTPTLFCGVDPGLNGAVALIGPNQVTVFDMPVHEITVGKTVRKRIDMHALTRWFELYAQDIRLCTLEDVGPHPNDSPTSAFNFGKAAGAAEMAIAASGTPYRTVVPARWKGAMGLSADKDKSRQMASQLFPAWSHLWARKKDDGRAEAVLLALYGSRG